jgi:rod shape-determining protein MreD
MNNPLYILLPVNTSFILMSLLMAFIFNLLPLGGYYGVPDCVALAIVFWSIHEPRKVGIGVAFCLGLLMDVHDGSLLGENALSYTLLSYFSIMMHRRVLWFGTATQALHILPLLLIAQTVQLLVRVMVSGKFPGWMIFSESFSTAALWPVATWILLAPQRRAIDHDATRPI